MKIIAHRGASFEFPENTLSAFRRAAEIGVDEIETDLVETRDGIILLHHDETLRHGTRADPICQLTFAEVSGISASIPKLEDVLKELGSQVSFCLELKVKGLAARVAAMINKYGLKTRTHVTSFKTEEVSEVKKLCPEAAFSWTFSVLPEGIEQKLRRAEIGAVSVARDHVTEGLVRSLLGHGIKTRVYTVNEVALAERYALWGVDAIFTDDPARMQSFRKR